MLQYILECYADVLEVCPLNELENARLERLLETVQKPARYIGGEMNSVVKDWDKVRCTFGFCFADTYEIGMSH